MKGTRMARKAAFFLSVLAVLAGAAGPSSASDPAPLLDRWFEALQSADAEALAAIMDDGATVTLKDLDITQSKAEFLDSMGEWADAIEGGSISHKPAGVVDEAGAIVLVCYRFASNAQLNTETFTFRDGRVTSSTQVKTAEDCSAF
jgi:ketosteroid isomerase-like protein